MATETETSAKKIHIYRNGDRFSRGRRFVINPRQTRNYDAFLNQVTHSLNPAFGAVRVLRTPENGHAVSDLNDLETGRSYVACAQKFIKLGYDDISTKPKPAPSPERRNRVIASGKIRKIERHPISIFVYTNGEPLEPARRVLLKPWVQKTWETILLAISEKINLRSGAIRHLVEYNGKNEVTEGVHLKNNEYYVAVGSEKFKDMDYSTQPLVLSPKQQQKRRYPTLQPLKKKSKSGNTTDESQGSSPLESSTNSTQSMGNRSDDHPKARKKQQPVQTNNEEGIPVKPIKHKRGSSDKTSKENREIKEDETQRKAAAPPANKKQPAATQPVKKNNNTATVDLDKDEGGVFKSKGRKQKAQEVAEDKNVKEEVPIDKRKAETVDDEHVDIKQKHKKEPLPPTKRIAQTDTKPKEQEPKPTTLNKKQPIKPIARKEDKKPIETEKKETNKQLEKSSKENKKQEPAKNTDNNKSKEPEKAEESNVSNGEEEQAAIKIQAQFRGYQVRKEMAKDGDKKSQAVADDDENAGEAEGADGEQIADTEQAAIKIQAQYRGYKVRKDMKAQHSKTEEAESDNKPEDTDEDKKNQEEAAIKIQSSFRGHQARKEVNAMKEAKKEEARAPSSQSQNKDDEEMENAAIKIQANYRGYRARKQYGDAKIMYMIVQEIRSYRISELVASVPSTPNHSDAGRVSSQPTIQSRIATPYTSLAAELTSKLIIQAETELSFDISSIDYN